MGESYFSHSWPDHSTPDAAQRDQGRAFVTVLRRAPPGAAYADRWTQIEKCKGATYIAVREIMYLAGGASYEILKRKKRKRNRSTFAGNSVAKAVALPQSDGRDEEYVPFDDYDHRLCKLARRPNPNDNMGELTAKLVMQNRLTGVGPLWAVPNADRRPVELWALKTPFMYPLYQATRQYPNGLWRVRPQVVAGWSGMLPSAISMMGADLPGEEVVRFMDPHPRIDWDGYSPLEAGAVHLDVLESINDSRKSAMDNGLNLDAVIIAPGMEQSSLDRLSAAMTEKAGGARNARKFVAIGTPSGGGPDGKVLLQTLGQSPKEMDYGESYEQTTRFCLALFGVNDVVAGLSQGSYSERYAARRDFHDRQEQYFNNLASWYTRVLCWPWCSFEDEFLFRISLPPVNDEEMEEQQTKNDVNIRSVNQRLARRNLPPVKHGEYPEPIYLKLLEQEVAPEPQPGVGGEQPADPSADPLAELLGGGGDTPTGGAVPGADNPDGEGTAVPTAKALRVRKAAGDQPRNEGEKWEGEGGKWFLMKGGRAVPTAAPGGEQPGGPDPLGAEGQDKPDPKAAQSRAAAAEVLGRVKAGGKPTPADLAVLRGAAGAMTPAERKAAAELVGGDREERRAGREEKRRAATEARTHHELNDPSPQPNWLSDTDAEVHAAELDDHARRYDEHHAKTREHLERAGASDKELGEHDRRVGKGKAALARGHEKLKKLKAKAVAARKAADDHEAGREELEAAEPEEPELEDAGEEPEAPEEPEGDFTDGDYDTPPDREGYDDDAGHAEAVSKWQREKAAFDRAYDEFEEKHAAWKQDHAAWKAESAAAEGRNAKATEAHEKARAAWESKVEKFEEKSEKLAEKADEAESAHDEADDEFQSDYADAADHVGEHVSETEDRIHARLDEEDDADAEPEDEDEDEDEYEDDGEDATATKAMSSLVGSAGGFLVPPAARGRLRRRKRARRVVKAILRDVEGE